jgi:chromosome segregation ATPase
VAFDTLKLARALRTGAQMSAEQAEGVSQALAEAMSGAELATKGDLRELAAEFRADLLESEHRLEARMGAVDVKVGALETRVAALDTRVGALGTEIGTLGAEIGGLDSKIVALDAKVAALDAKVAALDTKFDAKFAALDAKIDTKVGALDTKFEGKFNDLDVKFTGMKIEIATLSERIERRAAETESKLVRWLVATGAATVLSVLGAAWTILRALPVAHP